MAVGGDPRIDCGFTVGGKKCGLASPRLEREFSRLFRLCSAPNLSPLDVPERPAGSVPHGRVLFDPSRERLKTRASDYDPFVRSWIKGGRTLSAADYMAM